jgi:hypothetical protein
MMTYNAFVFFTVRRHFFVTWYYNLLSEIQVDILIILKSKAKISIMIFTIIQLVEVYGIELIDPEIIRAIEQGTEIK